MLLAVIRGTEGIMRLLTGLSFVVIMVAVVMQLLGRAGLFPAVLWTEEVSRFALLYLAAFGAGLSLRTGDMVNVDLVSESLPGVIPFCLRAFSSVLTLVAALMLLSPAWFFTSIGARQTAPASGIRMDFVHVTMVILVLSIAAFAALRLIGMATGRENGLPDKPEEDI